MKPSILATLVAACALSAAAAENTISLAGTWRFQLDRNDAGQRERWFDRALPGTIKLPGSLPAQGIGDDVSVEIRWTGGIVDRSWFNDPKYAPYRQPGNVKVPFWLQPEKYYVGPAWYQRDIEIPPGWQDKRIVLTLERAHWLTQVWLDGRFVGTNDSLSTPHDYDLGQLAPGRHTLTIRVDNRMIIDIGENSHSVSDHTQGNWNGLEGKLTLRATGLVWIEDLQVYADAANRSATVRGRLGNATGQTGQGTLSLRVSETARRGAADVDWRRFPIAWQPAGGTFEVQVPVAGPKLWDEFTPTLYQLEARLQETEQPAVTLFGFREISTQGTQFLINDRKTFMRGTLECAIFPKTGHTPTDLDSWRKVIGAAKAHGLNNLRFHSHCPPEAAFVVADEMGMYLQVECGSWANQSTTLGDGKPVDEWIYRETDRILEAYGNHPSFVFLLYGNEPGGRQHVAYLKEWVEHYKAKDPRRLYSSGAGWPQIPENEFHVTPDPRIQAWGGGLKSRINARPPETITDYRGYIRQRSVPVISHEIGQWCVYPNFDEMTKYTGYLKPKNFEIFRDFLNAHHLGALARQFLLASGKLQTLCYKEDIESALRTPGMGGFQLLDLHDFPGQGTALVGVLDPFWESKGYVTAEEYSRFCNSTVPLARLGRRVFTTDDILNADLEVAHFGPAPIEEAVTQWKLVDDNGQVWAAGKTGAQTIPVDNAIPLGNANVELKNVPAPARYKLVVSVGQPRGRAFENDWDLWVYPTKVEIAPPTGVTMVEDLSDDALATLREGGKVLLLIPPNRVKNAPEDKVALGFSSIFWNTAWTRRQAPTTLGILCDPKHPALAAFPTDYHSNWQWWYLVSRAGAMILDDLPQELAPTVQVIDDWFTARKLGLVIEAKLGRGRLLVCSIDLKDRLTGNPVARQMRHSLLRYMAGDRFHPTVELTADQVRSLMAGPSGLEKLGLRAIRANSFEPGYEPANAIDGDPNTMWHTAWTQAKPGLPHELILEFKEPITARGFTFMPRQDNNRNGWIREYAIYACDNGKNWGDPVAQGSFPNNAQRKTVTLGEPVTARFIRVVALTGHSDGPYASLAEIDVVTARAPGAN